MGPGWAREATIGFFRYDVGGLLAIGHQGSHPGFHSQILVAPEAGVGVMAFTNGGNDLWRPAELSALLCRGLGAAAVPPVARAQRPEVWDEICGWYRVSARLTDVRLRSMVGAGAEVFVRQGQLMLRFSSPVPEMFRGFPVLPGNAHDPHVFSIELSESGPESMVSSSDGIPLGGDHSDPLRPHADDAREATGALEPASLGRSRAGRTRSKGDRCRLPARRVRSGFGTQAVSRNRQKG